MAELDAAVKKEKKIKEDILNLQWLYDTHFREDNSPTREYNLKEFLKLINRAEKQLESIRGVIAAQQIPEEIPSEEFHAEELVVDSLDSLDELIPSFFFSEQEVPTTDVEEYLIPSFLFKEEEDDSTVKSIPTEAVNATVNEFEKKNQILSFHKQLIGERFSNILNSSRNVFDPGKYVKLIKKFYYLTGVYEFGFDSITSCSFALYVYSILMDEFVSNFVYELNPRNGYWSDSWCGDSIVYSLTNGGVICTAQMLFDKMSGINVNLSSTVIGIDFLLHLKMGIVFDRGKDNELWIRYSKFDVCVKFLDGYYRVSLPELIHEQDVSSTQLQIHTVYRQSRNVVNHPTSSAKSLIDARVFDLGKGIGTIRGCPYFTGDSEFSWGLPVSYLFVLHVSPILRNGNNENLVSKLFLRYVFRLDSVSSLGYHSDFSAIQFIVLLCVADAVSCSSFLPAYTRLLFDRGKDFQLIKKFSCNGDFDSFTGMHLHFEEVETPAIISLSKFNQVTFGKVTDPDSKYCFNKSEELYGNFVYLKKLFLLHRNLLCTDSFYLNFDAPRWLFDRGKSTVCSWISYMRLIFGFTLHLGSDSNIRVIYSIVLMCIIDHAVLRGNTKLLVHITARKECLLLLLARVVVVEKSCQWLVQMLAMWRAMILILQLKCGLLHALTVPFLGSLVVIQIYIESFECFSEFIMFMLHQVFLNPQPCILFGLALWLYMEQGNWVVQIASTWVAHIAGTCAIARQISLQMIQVVSSASTPYAQLFFLLLLRLGYHSDFSVKPLVVLLCVIDTEFVEERKLTVTRVARIAILATSDVSVAWSRKCGAADTLLQLRYGWFFATGHTLGELWMWGIMQAQFMGYSCFSAFILIVPYVPPHPFNTPTILGDSGKLQQCLHQECNIRHQNFTKVYFFKYIIHIDFICASIPTAEYIQFIFDRGKEIEPIQRWSFYDRYICDGNSAHELILENVYYFVLLFGVLNVFELVINGERCDARQLVTELPHQVYIPWFVLTLLLARNKECGGVPRLHIFQQLCLFASSKCCDKYFMESSRYPTPSTQHIWSPLRVSTSHHTPFLEQATAVYSTFSTKGLQLLLYTRVLQSRKRHLLADMRYFVRYWVHTFINQLPRVMFCGQAAVYRIPMLPCSRMTIHVLFTWHLSSWHL